MEVLDRSSVSVWGRSSHEIEREFDLKIFYDLCRASREVVIQSKIELNNERRYVDFVKSMQELELAWDNYRFGEKNMVGGAMTQKRFCVQDILDDDRY